MSAGGLLGLNMLSLLSYPTPGLSGAGISLEANGLPAKMRPHHYCWMPTMCKTIYWYYFHLMGRVYAPCSWSSGLVLDGFGTNDQRGHGRWSMKVAVNNENTTACYLPPPADMLSLPPPSRSNRCRFNPLLGQRVDPGRAGRM